MSFLPKRFFTDSQRSDGTIPFEYKRFGTPLTSTLIEVTPGLKQFSEFRVPPAYGNINKHNIPVIDLLGRLICWFITVSVGLDMVKVLCRVTFS